MAESFLFTLLVDSFIFTLLVDSFLFTMLVDSFLFTLIVDSFIFTLLVNSFPIINAKRCHNSWEITGTRFLLHNIFGSIKFVKLVCIRSFFYFDLKYLERIKFDIVINSFYLG